MTIPELPGYTDLVEVASGASSIVYRANEPAHGRQVAIKVLKSADLTAAERLAFDREVTAMGQLSSHPHVVDLIGSGFTDGHPFIVMPFYRNGSYSSLVASEGRMAWPELADFGVKVASALETAHRQGLIHRDVKPANIYRGDYEAQPVLADFGVSSFLRPADDDAPTVGVAGTPLYLAPEVYDGVRPNVATDIYALGTTFYGLLEGRPAYAGRSIELVVAAVTSDEEPPVVTATVPDRLRRLVASMMAKDPGARPASALAVVGELNAIQRADGLLITPPVVRTADGPASDGGPGSGSAPLSPAGRAGSPRWPTAEPGGATENIDVLDRPTEPNPEKPAAGPRPVAPLETTRPGWRLAAITALVVVAALAAIAVLTGNNPLGSGRGSDQDLLAGSAPWSTEPELAGEVQAHDGPVTALSWSADGTTLATGAVDSSLRIWSIDPDPAAGSVLAVVDRLEVGGWILDLAWSADGGHLAAVGTGGVLRIWETTDGGAVANPIVEEAVHDGPAEAVSWSPGGRTVATGGADGTLVVWDLDRADLAWRLTAHDGPVGDLDWSPVEPWLASGGRDGALRVWRTDDGQQVLDLAAHDDWVRGVAWSPRSSALASAASDGQAAVWDARTGDELRRRDMGADPVGGLVWAPGTDVLVFGTADGVTEGWALVADTTAPPIGDAGAEIGAIAWSPTGDQLAVGLGDGRVQVWTVGS